MVVKVLERWSPHTDAVEATGELHRFRIMNICLVETFDTHKWI